MKGLIYQFLFTGVFFGVMDSLWFGFFMREYAIRQLGPILKMKDGELAANIPAALIAYFMMIIIAAAFLFPKITNEMSLTHIFSLGFLLGMSVFGVFDFTNSALIQPYPLKFAIIDTLWGGFLYGSLAIMYSKLNHLI